MTEDIEKPRRGRPPLDREPMREPSLKMRAKPNWESFEDDQPESSDRLGIRPDLIPVGMSAQWVTDSIYGQPQPQHRATFEKRGWTPVHQSDFDGQFDGMFMPKGADGEIKVDGLVLMMRPKEITDRAKRRDRKEALEQVAIKEQALRGGDIGVSLDSTDPSAINSNRIKKSYERIAIPEG